MSWIAPLNGGAYYGYMGPGYTEEFWLLDVRGSCPLGGLDPTDARYGRSGHRRVAGHPRLHTHRAVMGCSRFD